MKHALAVGADCFTKIRHLVDEAQLRGQEVGHGWHHKAFGGVGLVASESAEKGQRPLTMSRLPTTDENADAEERTKVTQPKSASKAAKEFGKCPSVRRKSIP
jgi:hypothetical protein